MNKYIDMQDSSNLAKSVASLRTHQTTKIEKTGSASGQYKQVVNLKI